MKKFLFVLTLIAIAGGYYYLTFKSESVTLPNPLAPKQIRVKFAVLSDTHSDSENTRKALQQAKERGAEFIMSTGDLTTIGSVNELTEAKKDFDSVGLEYHLVPGDHDLYKAAGTANFENIIGRNYYVTDKKSVRLVSLDTSDTSLGIDSEQMGFLRQYLKANDGRLVLVFMHLPIYHPTSPRTIWEKEGNNSTVKGQADEVINLLTGSDVIAVFAGDHHFSSSYTEPKSGVKMYVVGAVTRERNLQKPRFDMVTVYKDNSFEVKEMVIE